MTEIVAPTPIDALPAAPQPTDTPAEFNTKSFALVAAEVNMIPQQNAANAQTFQNATAAQERATAADASADAAAIEADLAMGYRNTANAAAGTATTQAGIATGAASTATTQAGLASTARTGAETARSGSESARVSSILAKNASEAARDASQAYRDQAEVFATKQLVASSTTSVTPGAGAKSFVIEASRSFVVGMYLVATSQSDPNTRMSGYVQSYNGTTGALVIAVDAFAGASAKADWVIGVAARSADGSLVQQVITANTTAVPGVLYVIAGATVTLTLPTTGLSNDSRIDIVLAAPVSRAQIVDFGGINYRGVAAGQRYIDRQAWSMSLQFNATRGEWI